ncbi:MAG: UDP-N-acetylglucosamine 4,6-dehydratase (inverting) [Candidatus Falkowbacteria bacterium]
MLNNKTVLITGGTGSFGRGFSKFLLHNFNLKKLIIFSRDECKQFHMQKEINDARVRFFLGDVRDLQRLERAFSGVDIVIHAAALKQVPTLEYNPFEAVKTNIVGSQNVINASINQKVKKVILISTDKAAQPINLYGSTKLCAEKLFINGNSYSGEEDDAKFSCVRYGNVIGSRGSIIETILNNQDIEKVCVTDEKMTRFWITIDQAFRLVLFTLENMVGGEIVIPKAPSMKLIDLFSSLAPNAQKEIIGIRPGEKLHEVLLTSDESRHSIELDDYFLIFPESENIFNQNKYFNKYFKKMPNGFSFTSDNNTRWLTKENLIEIVNNIKI